MKMKAPLILSLFAAALAFGGETEALRQAIRITAEESTFEGMLEIASRNSDFGQLVRSAIGNKAFNPATLRADLNALFQASEVSPAAEILAGVMVNRYSRKGENVSVEEWVRKEAKTPNAFDTLSTYQSHIRDWEAEQGMGSHHKALTGFTLPSAPRPASLAQTPALASALEDLRESFSEGNGTFVAIENPVVSVRHKLSCKTSSGTAAKQWLRRMLDATVSAEQLELAVAQFGALLGDHLLENCVSRERNKADVDDTNVYKMNSWKNKSSGPNGYRILFRILDTNV